MTPLVGWLRLVSRYSSCCDPVVTTKLGGKAGGGAVLTPFGEELLRQYRDLEVVAHVALRPHLTALESALAGPAEEA